MCRRANEAGRAAVRPGLPMCEFDRAARKVIEDAGYGKYFINQTAYPLIDDHYYVNTLGGVPCIDIIHYDARSATGFPAWWHTREDDMRNISHETLQAVGEVVMAMVQK